MFFKKLAKISLFVTIPILIITGARFFIYRIQWNTFESVPATVVSVRKEVSKTRNAHDSTKITTYYASFEYNYNDKEYKGNLETYYSISKGDRIYIRVNPNTPDNYVSGFESTHYIIAVVIETLIIVIAAKKIIDERSPKSA